MSLGPITWKKAAAAVVAAVVLALVTVFVYLTFLRAEGPDAFELRSADEVADQGTAVPFEGIEGAWVVGPESEAGYRVVEDIMGGLSDFEAVGRTSRVTGNLEIDGTTVTEAAFEVDIASMESDDRTRDDRFRNRIMNSTEFPVASFVLTAPIDLGPDPDSGDPISVDASGELTLRGVTQPVDFTIDAQLVQGEIEAVGSILVVFADYGIDNPSVERVVAVRDEGTVEFRLIFVR